MLYSLFVTVTSRCSAGQRVGLADRDGPHAARGLRAVRAEAPGAAQPSGPTKIVAVRSVLDGFLLYFDDFDSVCGLFSCFFLVFFR